MEDPQGAQEYVFLFQVQVHRGQQNGEDKSVQQENQTPRLAQQQSNTIEIHIQ